MGLQRYRADTASKQPDGATVWRTVWMGGRPLAKVENCRLADLAGDMRRTVYVTGEADTWFSQPAVCVIQGATVRGYVTSEDDNIVFRHCYY